MKDLKKKSGLLIIASHKNVQIQVSCTAGVEQTMDNWEGHVTGPVTLSPNQWLMFKMWPALCVDLNTTSFSQVYVLCLAYRAHPHKKFGSLFLKKPFPDLRKVSENSF